MGLSWQQGPLGRNPNGQFLVPGMPERVLYAEPLRRRLRAELGGRTVVQSDDAVVLFEPGRYPVAYFPHADFAEGALRPTEHRTRASTSATPPATSSCARATASSRTRRARSCSTSRASRRAGMCRAPTSS